MNNSGELSRFVGRVHRRQVVLRLLEHAGVGLALAAAIAMVVADTLENVFILMSLGTLMGLLIGWLRRPSTVNSAMEADRQFGLKDLLSSALSINNPTDPWQRALLASAGTKVRQLSPSSLRFRRLNAGGWCVIGGIALLSMGMRVWTDAAPAEQNSSGRRIFLDRDELARSDNWLSERSNSTSPSPMPESTDRSKMNSRPIDHSDKTTDETKPESGNPTDHSSGGLANQRGAGSAQTQTDQPVDHHRPDASESHTDTSNGRTAGGTGKPMNHANGETASATSTGTKDRTTESTPPWQGGQWETRRQSAAQAMHNGQIPGRYRDLVKAYFSIE